eukprot:TRINITY_DN3972_c0_g1_i2.p1 TRINITY_DN3972_c0_g1~~TRINITY_DN3972_c0_g1_i2.p1  ORF type:complete len:245 (+),score=27.99 TRINITY_DN3972_c0_g1_i2:100-834(+)
MDPEQFWQATTPLRNRRLALWKDGLNELRRLQTLAPLDSEHTKLTTEFIKNELRRAIRRRNPQDQVRNIKFRLDRREYHSWVLGKGQLSLRIKTKNATETVVNPAKREESNREYVTLRQRVFTHVFHSRDDPLPTFFPSEMTTSDAPGNRIVDITDKFNFEEGRGYLSSVKYWSQQELREMAAARREDRMKKRKLVEEHGSFYTNSSLGSSAKPVTLVYNWDTQVASMKFDIERRNHLGYTMFC